MIEMVMNKKKHSSPYPYLPGIYLCTTCCIKFRLTNGSDNYIITEAMLEENFEGKETSRWKCMQCKKNKIYYYVNQR